MEKMQQTAGGARAGGPGRAAPARPPPARGVTRVQVEPPALQPYLWSGTMGLAGLVGQAAVVFFIAFFLLSSGDTSAQDGQDRRAHPEQEKGHPPGP